jgi:hypothetical protein
MIGSNDDEEAPTELVMKKEAEYVHIWVVVDGEEVFHASPHVKMIKGPVQAAIQTFLSRAYQAEIEELSPSDDSKGFL